MDFCFNSDEGSVRMWRTIILDNISDMGDSGHPAWDVVLDVSLTHMDMLVVLMETFIWPVCTCWDDLVWRA